MSGETTEPTILHLCTRYRRGGSEQRLRDCVAAVAAKHVVILGDDSDVQQATVDLAGSATVESMAELVRAPSPTQDLAALRSLVTRLRHDRVALVVTHQSKAGLLGRTAGRMTGTPILHSLSMANTGPSYGLVQRLLFSTAERLAADWAAGYMVVGRDLAARAIANGVAEERCHVIRSGVKLPRPGINRQTRRQSIPELHPVGNEPLVVVVGSLEHRKQSLDLPELHTIIENRFDGPRPWMLIAGDGPERRQLERRIEDNGLQDRIHLLGHIDWAAELIAAADLIVMLSKAEGLPQVLVQAAAADTPFAAFEVDGPKELIESGARGVVVANRNLELLGQAAADWLMVRSESTAPRINLESWSSEHIAERYRTVCDSVIGQHEFA